MFFTTIYACSVLSRIDNIQLIGGRVIISSTSIDTDTIILSTSNCSHGFPLGCPINPRGCLSPSWWYVESASQGKFYLLRPKKKEKTWMGSSSQTFRWKSYLLYMPNGIALGLYLQMKHYLATSSSYESFNLKLILLDISGRGEWLVIESSVVMLMDWSLNCRDTS